VKRVYIFFGFLEMFLYYVVYFYVMKRGILVIIFLILLSSFVIAKDECVLDKDCYNLDHEFASLMYCDNYNSGGLGECVIDEGMIASLGWCIDGSWCEENEDCSSDWVCVSSDEEISIVNSAMGGVEVLEPIEVGIIADAECKVKKDCELLDPDFGFAYSCTNGECVINEKLASALDLSCSSAGECEEGFTCLESFCVEIECSLDEDCEEGFLCVDNFCEDLGLEVCSAINVCEEGTCVDGYCITDVAIETETYGVGDHCTVDLDCEYTDDVCVEGMCNQAFGFPAYILVGDEKVFLEDKKVCVDDSDCGFREFCDVGSSIDEKHYCSVTPNAAETSVKISSMMDPLYDIVDVTRIAMTGDEAKKIELEMKRLERSQKIARELDALAAKGVVSVEKVEKKFKFAEERLESVDVKIEAMKTTLESSTTSPEEKAIIEQNLQNLEEKNIKNKLDVGQDLQTAALQSGSQVLSSQQKKLEVKNRLEDSQLSDKELKTKKEVVEKRNEEHLKKLENRKLSSSRPSMVSSGSSAAAPSSSGSSAQQSSGGLTPEQIRIIKEKEKRKKAAAQSSA
jgi:hypothetical protein